GSRGWCRAIVAAVWADTGDRARMLELIALLGSTDPDPDPGACIAHVEAQFWVVGAMVTTAPEPMVRAHMERLGTFVDSVIEAVPADRRYLHLGRMWATIYRYPRPWSAMIDYREALRLTQEVADRRLELWVRATGSERGWVDLGDPDAPNRMLALEEK